LAALLNTATPKPFFKQLSHQEIKIMWRGGLGREEVLAMMKAFSTEASSEVNTGEGR